jgi:hypothetical protein
VISAPRSRIGLIPDHFDHFTGGRCDPLADEFAESIAESFSGSTPS